nr:hypothetical protein GCM10020185_84580 [Pseudomonas brassicacearum subsp. brassicacearum]
MAASIGFSAWALTWIVPVREQRYGSTFNELHAPQTVRRGKKNFFAILAAAAFETVFAAMLAPFAQHAGGGHAVNLFRVKGHGRLLNRWKAQ